MSNNTKRNVLMILCDELRPDFLSAYGGDFIPTPNIDALAANGVVFDNSITASTVCAPARAAIATGEFVSGHGYWTNEVEGNADLPLFTDRLHEQGYMTAGMGSIELHPDNDMHMKYVRRFSEEKDNEYILWMREKHPEVTNGWGWCRDGKQFKYTEEEYFDRWTTDRAEEFLDSYVATGKAPNGAAPDQEGAPFFLYCGFWSPHSPHLPPKEVSGSVDPDKLPPMIHKPLSENTPSVEAVRCAFLNPPEVLKDLECLDAERMRERQAYAEVIVEVDRLVGRLVDALKRNGVYENTTIIFTSDHGSCDNDYNLATKGPWPYTSQLFVPLIVSNHPRLPAGTHSDTLCGSMDIGATVLDVAGDNRRFGLSRSLIGLAEGSVPEREVNMSEFCDSCKTLVDKQYTFTYYPFTGKCCLYDRIADPLMMNDLGGKPEYAAVERKFLMDVVDFLVLAKGVRIEAHDLTNDIQAGIIKKDPKFLDNFDIAYPIGSMAQIERLKQAGLEWDFNEFCKTRPIMAHYGLYFEQK